MAELITTKPKHSKSAFLLGGSLAWQKLSFYGWRSIIFLLFLDDVTATSRETSIDYIFWVLMGISFCYFLGGVLGDLLLGNRLTAIIGAGFMLLGSLLFFIDPSMSPLIPIIIFIVGCGLYESNLKAMFAKLYLHDKRLLDSGFTLLYIFTNIGSFFGALLIGLFEYKYGIAYGFLAVGIAALFSCAMLFLAKPTLTKEPIKKEPIINKSLLKPALIFLVLLAIYTIAIQLSYVEIYLDYWTINFDSDTFNFLSIDVLNLIFFLTIGIYLVFLWSRKHFSPFTKLTISVIAVLVSFGLSFLFCQEGFKGTAVITIAALFIYSIAELHIAPLIDSLIARMVNSRFLTIGYGACRLIAIGVAYLLSFIVDGIRWLTDSKLYVAFGILLLLLITVLIVRKFSLNRSNSDATN